MEIQPKPNSLFALRSTTASTKPDHYISDVSVCVILSRRAIRKCASIHSSSSCPLSLLSHLPRSQIKYSRWVRSATRFQPLNISSLSLDKDIISPISPHQAILKASINDSPRAAATTLKRVWAFRRLHQQSLLRAFCCGSAELLPDLLYLLLVCSQNLPSEKRRFSDKNPSSVFHHMGVEIRPL